MERTDVWDDLTYFMIQEKDSILRQPPLNILWRIISGRNLRTLLSNWQWIIDNLAADLMSDSE